MNTTATNSTIPEMLASPTSSHNEFVIGRVDQIGNLQSTFLTSDQQAALGHMDSASADLFLFRLWQNLGGK